MIVFTETEWKLAGSVENRQTFPSGSFGGSISIYSSEVHFCLQFELVCEGAGRLAGDDTLLGKMAAVRVAFS